MCQHFLPYLLIDLNVHWNITSFLVVKSKNYKGAFVWGITFTDKLSWKCHIDVVVKKAHSRLYCLRKLRSFDVHKEISQSSVLYSYFWQCFNFWNDLLGWKCIQTGQTQTWQEHREGRWGGGQKARKHRHSLSLISDKLITILADKTHSLRPEFDNGHIYIYRSESKTTGYLVIHSNCHSHTFNKQADKHNTQWLQMGMLGQ